MKRRYWQPGVLALFLCVAATPNDLAPTPVADAAESGDHETLRALLSDGADVNTATGDGMSALHWAAERGDVAMAQQLLYAGANVDATTRLAGYTPLLLAAQSGHGRMIEALLDAGSDPADATSTGATALMFAAASGSEYGVQQMLARGAEIDRAESTGGQTALMFAAASGRHDVIRLLITEGADPARATNIVDAPKLNQALDKGFRERIEQLRKDREEAADVVGVTEPPADADAPTGNIFSRLFGWLIPGGGEAEAPAARRERESYGVRVGMQGGITPMLYAARQGEDASVQALIEGGADVNQVAAGSKTSPLLIATMNGHFDLAMDLLEKGADPNLAAEPSSITPLYAAVNLQWAPHAMYPQPVAHKQQRTTHLELVEALLEAGANPNSRLTKKVWFMHYNFDTSGLDETGATPFWRAAYGSDVPVMKVLVAYGADPNLRTQNAGSRRYVAEPGKENEKDPSGLPPVPEGGPSMTALHAATGAGFGAGFAANDHRNHPAGFMPAVKYLVEECGADVNARDHLGSVPLHNAASRGDVEMIEYLVSQGADVTPVTRRGQTTADMANGPVQRINPFPEARDLLVGLGAVNNDRCVSC